MGVVLVSLGVDGVGFKASRVSSRSRYSGSQNKTSTSGLFVSEQESLERGLRRDYTV